MARTGPSMLVQWLKKHVWDPEAAMDFCDHFARDYDEAILETILRSLPAEGPHAPQVALRLAAIILAVLTFGACNTVAGVGKDVERGGEKLQDTARDVQRKN